MLGREGKLAWVINLQISLGLLYGLDAEITTTQKFSKFSASKRCNNKIKNKDSRHVSGLRFNLQYHKGNTHTITKIPGERH